MFAEIIVLWSLYSVGTGDIACNPVYFRSSDTPVCMCNDTYCDELDPIAVLVKGISVSYTSSKAGLRFLKISSQFQSSSPSPPTITVDVESTYQTILGWGGAFTDSTGINVNNLNGPAREFLLRSYFSAQGIQYSLCRVPIGGTDFSTRDYSYDDGPPDAKLKNFTLQYEDYNYKIPLMKAAMAMSFNPLKFFASDWTAPNWMRKEQNNGTYYTVKKRYYKSWANYYIKFLEAYEEAGIDFWGLTTGNEPLTMSLSSKYFPFTGWTTTEMKNWVRNHMGPTLRRSKYKNTKLITLDDQRSFLKNFTDAMFASKKVEGFIDGIGVHWYFDGSVSTKVLTDTHKKYPSKFLLATEASIISNTQLGDWENAEAYISSIIDVSPNKYRVRKTPFRSRDTVVDSLEQNKSRWETNGRKGVVISDVNNWVTGWIDWNMALDMDGGPTFINNTLNAAIYVDGKVFYKQPTFYAIGHFSKFVSVGSTRVRCTNTNSNLKTVAFRRPDNGTVVIVSNSNSATTVVIHDQTRGYLSIEIESNSITTVLYW